MCDTEVYTIRVDTVNTTVSNVDFVSYINIPLRNVVKAELLSASIAANASDTPAIYIYIDELVSKFNDRATLQYTLSSSGKISTQGAVTADLPNLQYLKSSLAAIPTGSHAHRLHGIRFRFPNRRDLHRTHPSAPDPHCQTLQGER